MSKKDYDKFLFKIDQLNKLIVDLNNSPDKYNLFINCKTHEEVIELAKKWGFQINSRWGEN